MYHRNRKAMKGKEAKQSDCEGTSDSINRFLIRNPRYCKLITDLCTKYRAARKRILITV